MNAQALTKAVLATTNDQKNTIRDMSVIYRNFIFHDTNHFSRSGCGEQ